MKPRHAWVLAVVAASIAVLACVAMDSGHTPRTSQAPTDARIAVVVGPRHGTPLIGADGAYKVFDTDGRAVHGGASLPADTKVRATSREVKVGGLILGQGPFEVRPVGRTVLSVQGKPYRGALLLRSRGGTEVLNLVDVEDYLLGVVPSEMPDRFGLEALKAQTVAARSYALNARDRGQRLYADQRSQVYGGIKAESLASTRAVKQTAGQVLRHDGEILPAWYHSTCGGLTRPAAELFPDAPRGVLDRGVRCQDCLDSPHYSWSRSIPTERVCKALKIPVGRLDGISFKPGRFPARDETITVRSAGHQGQASGDDFRARLSSGRPYSQQVLSTLWSAPPRVVGDALVIEGRGWGHGIGLCQYGARGWARRGKGYREILEWYYPGAELASLP